MRRKLRLLAAIATLFVVLVAIGSFVYMIGKIHSSGERSSEAEYSILRNALMSIQSRADLQTDLLRNRLMALFQGSDRLLAVKVLDESGLVLWKIPTKSRYFALPNETQVRSGYSAPPFSTVVLSTPLIDGMKATALYTTLKRSDISSAVLPSFIIALVWFAALIIAFIFLLKDSNIQKEPAGIDVPPLIETSQEVSEVSEPQETPEAPKPEELPELEPKSEAEPINETSETNSSLEASWLNPSIREGASGKNFEESFARLEEEVREWSSRKPLDLSTSAPTTVPALDPYQASEPKATPLPLAVEAEEESIGEELQEKLEETESNEEDERSLPDKSPDTKESDVDEAEKLLKEFEQISAQAKIQPPISEATKFQAKQVDALRRDLADLSLSLSLQNPGLEQCLSEELGKSRADLALILIHCGLSSDTDPVAIALSVTLKDYIGSKDLVFELYKGAFAVVLPSVDLGAALKMSEDLADVLSATYSLYNDLEGEAPVYLGISARSNRSVDAFKLYREASTAVHKAYSGGPSKILAFRPKTE